MKLESLEDTTVVASSRLVSEQSFLIESRPSLYLATSISKHRSCSVKYVEGQIVFDTLVGDKVVQTSTDSVTKPDCIDIVDATDGQFIAAAAVRESSSHTSSVLGLYLVAESR